MYSIRHAKKDSFIYENVGTIGVKSVFAMLTAQEIELIEIIFRLNPCFEFLRQSPVGDFASLRSALKCFMEQARFVADVCRYIAKRLRRRDKPYKQFETDPSSRSKLREAVGSRLLLSFSHAIFVRRNYLPKIAAFCRNCSRLAAFSSSSHFRSSCSMRISSSNLDAFQSCSILASKKCLAPVTPTSSTSTSVSLAS